MKVGVKVKFKRDVDVSLPTEEGILKVSIRSGMVGVVSDDGDGSGCVVVRLSEPWQTGHDIAVDNVKWRDWKDALQDIFITGKGHIRIVSVDGELVDEG